MANLTLNDPLFGTFVFYASVLAMKTLFMSIWTARYRLAKKVITIFISVNSPVIENRNYLFDICFYAISMSIVLLAKGVAMANFWRGSNPSLPKTK